MIAIHSCSCHMSVHVGHNWQRSDLVVQYYYYYSCYHHLHHHHHHCHYHRHHHHYCDIIIIIIIIIVIITVIWGRNSSVGSAWARCPRCRGFDPPLGTFSGRGDFSLGVNMGSNSIPPKTPSDESINRGLVCAHMHFIARTQKILTFMS